MINHRNIITAIIATNIIIIQCKNTTVKPFPTQAPAGTGLGGYALGTCTYFTGKFWDLEISIPENAKKITTEFCRELDDNTTYLYPPNKTCHFHFEEAVYTKHFIEICDYLGYNLTTIRRLYDKGIKDPYRPPFTQKVPVPYKPPAEPGNVGSKGIKWCAYMWLMFSIIAVGKLLSYIV